MQSRDRRSTHHGQGDGRFAAPTYLGNPAHVDPEEAFVASLSSCHMLTFLAIACKQKFVLDSYEDEAV
jgi:organic hydroperoxide reductase OsmC/OhrA